MTVEELKLKLDECNDDAIVVLGDIDGGWSNIETVINSIHTVSITMEDDPVFSN